MKNNIKLNDVDITDDVIESRDLEEDLTANEMFEKLGYKRNESFTFKAVVDEYINEEDGDLFEINFWLEHKEISKKYNESTGNITMQELKAINKKVKELGWVNE